VIDSISRSRANEFFYGVRSELPLLLGVFPFGLIYGVMALQAGLPPAMAQGMSSIVFAGASQLMITQLVSGGAPMLIIILTAFVVNLRHALYSASMAPYFKNLSPLWKLLLGYLLTDEAYGVGITRYVEPSNEPFKHWFVFGAGLTLWAGWQVSSACGIFRVHKFRLPGHWILPCLLYSSPSWCPCLRTALVSRQQQPGVLYLSWHLDCRINWVF
jgi:4-azaleucine resistance transporter AzlC